MKFKISYQGLFYECAVLSRVSFVSARYRLMHTALWSSSDYSRTLSTCFIKITALCLLIAYEEG